jgi:hypothetical protein
MLLEAMDPAPEVEVEMMQKAQMQHKISKGFFFM